ncbi:MAG: type IV toxin-antitoxin system AbiEi family antitoxin domain-containing protein [Gaiellales bacterium]
MAISGLSAENRMLLSRLHQVFEGPFTIVEASEAMGLELSRVSRLLRHLAAQGWLVRVRRGLYATVPLGAERPQEWSADPWAVAARALDPGYIGGWSALHHWDLTEQLFVSTVCFTARPVAHRRVSIGGTRFELRHRNASLLFGTRRVWRSGVPVPVSDPERTLVDCLDDPTVGGGMRHVVDALRSYAGGSRTRWSMIVEYGDRLGNRTVFKRLGYIAEALELADDALLDSCRARVSAGIGRLDPALPARGPIVTRWGLRINSGVDR